MVLDSLDYLSGTSFEEVMIKAPRVKLLGVIFVFSHLLDLSKVRYFVLLPSGTRKGLSWLSEWV